MASMAVALHMLYVFLNLEKDKLKSNSFSLTYLLSSTRVKLFLEQFSIRSCVLNSQLPASSRMHIIFQFNNGFYDIIIAAGDAYKFKATEQEEKQRKKDK